MLITSVFVNERPIDDLFVHNIGHTENGIWEYEILDHVTGEKLIEETILHKRDEGYRSLLIKVLTLLEKHKIPSKPIDREKAFWIKTALEDRE